MKAFGLGSSSLNTLPVEEASSSSMEEEDSSEDGAYDWFVDGFEKDEVKQTVDATQAKSFVEYMDEAQGKHVRLYEDGSIVPCSDMVEGPSGFLMASWHDGSFTKTEIPSILYSEAAVYKKPATKRVRKEDELHPPVSPAKKTVATQPKKKAHKTASDVQFEFPADRFDLFPNGCAKCRGRKGCTRSCWIYRLRLHK